MGLKFGVALLVYGDWLFGQPKVDETPFECAKKVALKAEELGFDMDPRPPIEPRGKRTRKLSRVLGLTFSLRSFDQQHQTWTHGSMPRV
jgi:hypothetical protein